MRKAIITALAAVFAAFGTAWAVPPGFFNAAIPIPVTSLANSGTPILFQHISTSTNPAGLGISGHAFVMHTEPLPANTVAVIGVTALASKTVTVSSTLNASWTNVCSATGGTGNLKAWVFVANEGATGGVDTVTVGVGTSATQPVQFDLTFWENINTSSITGGSLCSASGGITPSSGVISPGSFTPTNNNANGGNVIWTYVAPCANVGSNTSAWTAGTGFTLLNAEIIWTNDQGFPQAAQYEVQTTAASVTPSISETGDSTGCFNSASVALAVANNSATAPSTIHVAGIFHESVTGWTSPGTMNVQIPFKGNLRVATFTWPGMSPNGGAGTITSITSSDSCNFTAATNTTSGGNNIWYAQGCSACPTCTVSLVWTGTESEPQMSFRIYDVQNALSSSYQNSISQAAFSCGTTVTDAPTFTPTGASSGLTIEVTGNGNGPITGFASGAPTGAVFDLWTFTGQNDTDLADNADSSNHLYYSSTAAQNWNFTKTNGGDECYDAAAAFN